MDYDDEYDDAMEHEDSDYDTAGSRGMKEEERSGRDFDPLDITDPKNAYFFLSDDAQDELDGPGKSKMKCISCGHRFVGEIYDDCPECYSSITEEIVSEKDDEESD